MVNYDPLIIAQMEMISKGERDSLDNDARLIGAQSYEGGGGDSNDSRLLTPLL